MMSLRRSSRFAVFGAILLVVIGRSGAEISPRLQKLEKADFKKHRITNSDLRGLSEAELKLLRGILFGKHGRVFEEKDIQDFVQSRPWYKANRGYRVSDINETERKTMDAIKEAEWKLHKQVEQGDLRFYVLREFTEKELGTHTPLEWRLMRAEIEAIHGKPFWGESWLQSFFQERYWYRMDPDYGPKMLSSIERRNLAALITAEKKQRGIALLPGEMSRLRNQRLTPRMIQGLSLHELRLLRNEVYALNGIEFGGTWLDDYFSSASKEDDIGHRTQTASAPALTYTDERNIATILRIEELQRESLLNRPITEADLAGMFADDAQMLRYELLARRGKVFKTRWLARHFEGKDWYRADPGFNEKTLSELDRKNIAFLKTYEKKADRAGEDEAG